jgi:hypothetical protein
LVTLSENWAALSECVIQPMDITSACFAYSVALCGVIPPET